MVWKYSITYYKSKRFNISTSRFVEKYCPAAKLFEFIAKTTALNRISRKWHTTHLGLQSESVGLPASNIIIRIVDAAASQKHNRLYNFTLDLQDYLKTLFKYKYKYYFQQTHWKVWNCFPCNLFLVTSFLVLKCITLKGSFS